MKRVIRGKIVQKKGMILFVDASNATALGISRLNCPSGKLKGDALKRWKVST